MPNEETVGGPTAHLERSPRTNEEALTLVDRTMDYVRPFKRSLEKQWAENLSFLIGEQWVSYNAQTNRFTRHQIEGWVPTPITNYIVKHYDRAIDLFTSPDWTPRGRPASESQEDVMAAENSSKMLKHLRRTLATEEAMIDAAAWFVATGNVFLYSNWNPKANVLVRTPREELKTMPLILPRAVCQACRDVHPPHMTRQRCPTCGQGMTQMEDTPMYGGDGNILTTSERKPILNAKGEPEYDEFFLGEVEECIPNVFSIYPQPRSKWKDVMYIVEEVPFDLDQLVSVFGSKAKKVAAEDIINERISGFIESASRTADNSNQRKQENMTRVRYFRHIPSAKFPKGHYIISANGVILYHGDLDTVDGSLGYEHAKYRHIPGQLWGGSPITDIIPLQKRVNAVDSSIILNRKTMQNPRMLVPQGSGVTQIDGRPGLLIRWNPHNTGGAKPEILPGIGLPQDVLQERKQAVEDIEEVFGTQEVLGGQAPSGVEAGVALNILAEQAFKRFGAPVANWRNAWQRHEKRKLLIMKENYDEERVVEVAGDNAETETFYFSKADIGSTNDVIIEMDQGANFSKAAQDQRVIWAVQTGLLGDVRRPEIAGKVLERMDIEGFASEFTLDAKKSKRELVKMRNGEQVPPPNPFDNHQIHFSVETDFIKTSEFENLDPQMQQMIMQHTQQHQQAIQQAQMQAQQQALAAKGAPDRMGEQIVQSNEGQGQQQQIQAQ